MQNLKKYFFVCLAPLFLCGCYEDYPRLHDVPNPLKPAMSREDVAFEKEKLQVRNAMVQKKAQKLQENVRKRQ